MPIKFNKMNKTISISKGEQFIGFIDIFEFKKVMITEKRIVVKFSQVDSNSAKRITFTILADGRMLIEKGSLKVGYIDYEEFYEYMCNSVLDIKEFEQK